MVITLIRYTIKRLLYLIPILFGVTFLTFLMLYLAPSDPISMKYSSMATVGDSKYIEEKKEEMGLNDSFIKQYTRWSKNVLSGDFGISTKYNVPVKDEIAKRLPKTLALTGTSILITIFLAFPLGIISAKYKNKWIDYIEKAQVMNNKRDFDERLMAFDINKNINNLKEIYQKGLKK